MDIAILILLTLTFVALAILMVLLLVKKKDGSSSPSGDTSSLEKELEALKTSLPLLLKNSSLESVNELQRVLKQNAEDDSKRLAHFQQQLNDTLKKGDDSDTQRLLNFQTSLTNSLKASMDSINKKVDDNLLAIHKKVDESLLNGFKGTSESMEKLQKALGEIDAAQKNMASLSEEVLSLKGVLTNSQQRGRYGEMQLEMILESMFGETYKGELYDFQYVLTGGENGMRPDAVVFLDGEEKKQIMVIDAKFSLVGYENLFGQTNLKEEEVAELKKKFKDALNTAMKQVARYATSGKIIRPAIMFIPNDGVFAYVENEFPDLVENARRQSVILASPTILQPIIASFKVVQLDAKRTKNLEKINRALEGLGQEFRRFAERWDKIERSVNTLNKATDDFSLTVRKIGKKFDSVSSSEVTRLEAPEQAGEEPIALLED